MSHRSSVREPIRRIILFDPARSIALPNLSKLTAAASSLICVVAGLYLLSAQAVASNSFLELLAHGIGIYFIGKGLFVGPSLWKQAEQTELLAAIANRSASQSRTEPPSLGA
jgi:hypothetical protein